MLSYYNHIIVLSRPYWAISYWSL